MYTLSTQDHSLFADETTGIEIVRISPVQPALHAFALVTMRWGQISGLEAELGKLQSELLRHRIA